MVALEHREVCLLEKSKNVVQLSCSFGLGFLLVSDPPVTPLLGCMLCNLQHFSAWAQEPKRHLSLSDSAVLVLAASGPSRPSTFALQNWQNV